MIISLIFGLVAVLQLASCQEFDDHHVEHHHEEHHEDHHEEHYHEPHYKFEYEVKDSHTGDYKKHKESRKGDEVVGYYSLVEPDGTMREVHYTSAKHAGFNAVVTKNGHPIETPHHEHHEHHEEEKPFYEHAHVTEEHKPQHHHEIEFEHHDEKPEHHEIDEKHEPSRHHQIVHHHRHEPRYHHREYMSGSSSQKVFKAPDATGDQASRPVRPRHAYSVFESPKERRRAYLLWGKSMKHY